MSAAADHRPGRLDPPHFGDVVLGHLLDRAGQPVRSVDRTGLHAPRLQRGYEPGIARAGAQPTVHAEQRYALAAPGKWQDHLEPRTGRSPEPPVQPRPLVRRKPFHTGTQVHGGPLAGSTLLARHSATLSTRTRAVVVNFPHNPTGAVLDADQYAGLLELVQAHGCYLLWDSSFSELVQDGDRLPEPVEVLPRAVSFSTTSKAYGLPGLRVGWCIGPRELLADMVRLRDYVSISTSPLTEYLAARVVEEAELVLDEHRKIALGNRALLRNWAERHGELVTLPVPRGGVTAFPRLLGTDDSTDLCRELARRDDVLVVPGGCFDHPSRIRIGLGGAAGELVAGLQKVAARARVARRRRPHNVA